MSYLSDQDYDFIYSRVPRICVDLFIRNENGEVLLTKREIEPYIGHWHFPGGRVKFRESIHDAMKRICKAELGQIPGEYEVMGVCEFPEEVQKGQERHSISIVYSVEFKGDISLDGQASKFSFFSDLPSPIIPPQKDFLLKFYK